MGTDGRSIVGVLLCAGSSERMGFDKLTTPLAGRTAIARSIDALVSGGVTELICTVTPDARRYLETLDVPVPLQLVAGGRTRQESVKNALFTTIGDIAVIHDAARCLVSPQLVRRTIESAIASGSGVACAKSTDTVLQKTESGYRTIPRESVYLMQTPQTFSYREIASAYANADPRATATDDCTLYAQAGYSPTLVVTTECNLKLTTAADWALAERLLTGGSFGTGFDTHRLTAGRALILGGVHIPFEKGLLGHSDADVLAHAVMDALLGAAGLGDIGVLYPDSDDAFCGADSLELLADVSARVRRAGRAIRHVDATLICQKPRLRPFIPEMEQRLAAAMDVDAACVSVKATTTEGMNDEGRGLCISAQAIASLA